MTTSTWSPRAIGFVVVTTLVVVAVLVFAGKLGVQTFQRESTRRVEAQFARAGQLRKGMVVYVEGVRAGKVSDVSLSRDGRLADVTMDVDRDAGPLYRDASAAVRWKTVLGGAFYIKLDRGRASTGSLSRPIPASRTSTQVELEQLLSVDKGAARAGLRRLPRALSDALSSRSALSSALKRVDEVAPSLADGLEGLRGERDGDLRALLQQTAATVRGLDAPTTTARELIQGAAGTLQTTGARRADIRAGLRVAPGALAQTRATLRRLDGTLDLIDPVVHDLGTAAPQVAPTLVALRPTLRGADRLLSRTAPLLTQLRPGLRSLGRTADAARRLLVELRPGLHDLDATVLPYLNEKDSVSKRTTAQMIGPTFASLGPGMSGQEDQNGHFVRFPASGGSSPLYLPCQTYLNNPDKPAIIACQTLSKTLNQLLAAPPDGRAPGIDEPPPPKRKGRR